MMQNLLNSLNDSMSRSAAIWLRQGISPRRLALTLALGFAIGCLPVVGIPTVVCAALALALRLNLPAIQAANYAVMPLQLALMVPFVRLGGWLFAYGPQPVPSARALPQLSFIGAISRLSTFAGHAMLGWLVIAGPAVLLMTLTLTALLRRIPALSAEPIPECIANQAAD